MSDDLTFQDTPLYAWLKSNAWLLLGGFVALLAILLYRENAPSWRHSDYVKSWERYEALLNGPDGLDGLEASLAEARKDDRIYPWMVYSAARAAAETKNEKALALLKPELEALARSERILVATDTGRESMASALLRDLYGSESRLPKDPPAPEPDGSRIAITLSADDSKPYEIVIGLYESTAPMGTAALKEWVGAGRLKEQSARKVGTLNLNLTLLPLPTEGEGAAGSAREPLMVERAMGYFHSEGVLATGTSPGAVGVQDENNLQLFLGNSYTMDGQTTVLGKVVEGWQSLKDAVEAGGPNANFKILDARLVE